MAAGFRCRMISIGTAALSAALAASLLASPAVAATCDEYDRQMREAEAAGDSDKAAMLFTQAESSRACSGAELRFVGRNAALAFYRKAYDGSVAEGAREDLLRRGLSLGRPWQIAASVADIEQAKGQFESAATLFQEALDDLRDENANPTPPPREVIAELVKKAEEARLLSPVYVKRTDRNGAPSGLACPAFRGFEAKKTALPIEFEYRLTTFTSKGQAAVADMFDYLSRQGSPDIALIGHTDPRGSDSVNQKLSEDRAKAVADFLKSKGYTGQVATSGRGKRERFQADDPGRYDEEQLYQLDRRVELDRKAGGKGCAVAAQ